MFSPIAGWGIQETKKALELAQTPESVLTANFRYIIDGLCSINSINSIFCKVSLQRGSNESTILDELIEPVYTLWFSDNTSAILTLLRGVSAARKLIGTSQANVNRNSKLQLNSIENLYYHTYFSLFALIHNSKRLETTTVQAGVDNIITKYKYITPQLMEFVHQEAADILKSNTHSTQFIFWSKVVYYAFKWRMLTGDIPGFCRCATIVVENVIDQKILLLNESLKDPYFSKEVQSYDFNTLSVYSVTLTAILLAVCALEIADEDLKKRLLKHLKLDEVLEIFSQLKISNESHGNQIGFRVICFYYNFYFVLCSFIQASQLQANNDNTIFSIQQFETLLQLAVSFSLSEFKFPDVVTQLPSHMARLGKERPAYLRVLHSTGYIEFLCREILFNFDTRNYLQLEIQNDIESIHETKLEPIKLYLYEQMIEDQNYDQVGMIISILKEKMTTNSKIIQESLCNINEIHYVERFVCVSNFWSHCFNFETFLRLIHDLFEQSRNKNFANESTAQSLIKILHESLYYCLELLLSLPITNGSPSVTGCLAHLLNHAPINVVTQCIKIIRSHLTSRINSQNYQILTYNDQSVKQIKEICQDKKLCFSAFLSNLLSKNVEAASRSFYIELESLLSFVESIDFNMTQKFTNKIHDDELFREDVKILLKLLISFISDEKIFKDLEGKLQSVMSRFSQYYLAYSNFCYGCNESNHKKRLDYLLDIVSDSIQQCKKTNTDPEKKLLDCQQLFASTEVLINYVLYYLEYLDKPTNELLDAIRQVFSYEGVFSSITEAFAFLRTLYSSTYDERQVGQSKEDSMQTIVVLFYSEMINLFAVLLEKQVLAPNFVSKLFLDPSGQQNYNKNKHDFFIELLHMSSNIVQIKSEIHFSSNKKIVSAISQHFVNAFLMIEQEIINLIFFAHPENQNDQEMIDLFYKNLFISLFEFCKNVANSYSRTICTSLTKFAILKEDAFKIILGQAKNYPKKFEKLSSVDVSSLKLLIQAEINGYKDLDNRRNKGEFSCLIHDLVYQYNQIAGIHASNLEELKDICASLAETNISICNRLFEVFDKVNSEEVNNFLRASVSEYDYELLCKFPLEAVNNLSSFFQKICGNSERDKVQKAIQDLYLLCLSLLKSKAKPEIFTFRSACEENQVLLNLLAIFEHDSSKLEHFLDNYEDIVTSIVERAVVSDNSFPLLYLLIKTLLYDCDIKEKIIMHIVSLGLRKIDVESYQGDLSKLLSEVFFGETWSELEKSILNCCSGKMRVNSSINLKSKKFHQYFHKLICLMINHRYALY